MQSVNDKYVKQTMEALSNNQLNVEVVAVSLSQLPVREQKRFFKLAMNYAQVLEAHNDRGWTMAGLEAIARACKDLMDVVELHFPTETSEPTTGTEYVQI